MFRARIDVDAILSFAQKATVVGEMALDIKKFAVSWACTYSDYDVLIANSFNAAWAWQHRPVLSRGLTSHWLYSGHNYLEPEGLPVACYMQHPRMYLQKNVQKDTVSFKCLYNQCGVVGEIDRFETSRATLLGRTQIVKVAFDPKSRFPRIRWTGQPLVPRVAESDPTPLPVVNASLIKSSPPPPPAVPVPKAFKLPFVPATSLSEPNPPPVPSEQVPEVFKLPALRATSPAKSKPPSLSAEPEVNVIQPPILPPTSSSRPKPSTVPAKRVAEIFKLPYVPPELLPSSSRGRHTTRSEAPPPLIKEPDIVSQQKGPSRPQSPPNSPTPPPIASERLTIIIPARQHMTPPAPTLTQWSHSYPQQTAAPSQPVKSKKRRNDGSESESNTSRARSQSKGESKSSNKRVKTPNRDNA